MPTKSAGGLIEAFGVERGIVCLAGAGGKKSAIYRMAAESPDRIAITSTVHTPPFRKRLAAETLVAPEPELQARVADRADARIVAYACPSPKKARLAGVAPELVARIHAACGFDLTLVKADGARLRWVKAPGAQEPMLPARFDILVYIVSVRAVGRPLDGLVAHRPERVAELAGARPGEAITPEHIARLITHPRGGMKHAERARRVMPVINMLDTGAQRHTARRVAEQVLALAPALTRVVLTRMTADPPVVEIVEL